MEDDRVAGDGGLVENGKTFRCDSRTSSMRFLQGDGDLSACPSLVTGKSAVFMSNCCASLSFSRAAADVGLGLGEEAECRGSRWCMSLRIGRGDRNAIDTELVVLVEFVLTQLVMVLVLGIDKVLGDLRTVKHRGDVFSGSSEKFLPSTTLISAVFLSLSVSA